jgi:hypothetical protein
LPVWLTVARAVIEAGAAVEFSSVAHKPTSKVGEVVVVTEDAVAVSVRLPTTSTAVPPLTAIIAAVSFIQLAPPVHANESEPVAMRE